MNYILNNRIKYVALIFHLVISFNKEIYQILTKIIQREIWMRSNACCDRDNIEMAIYNQIYVSSKVYNWDIRQFNWVSLVQLLFHTIIF